MKNKILSFLLARLKLKSFIGIYYLQKHFFQKLLDEKGKKVRFENIL